MAELEMAAGGNADAADAYLHKVHRKYGGRNVLDVLARATDEEPDETSIMLFNHV